MRVATPLQKEEKESRPAPEGSIWLMMASAFWPCSLHILCRCSTEICPPGPGEHMSNTGLSWADRSSIAVAGVAT